MIRHIRISHPLPVAAAILLSISFSFLGSKSLLNIGGNFYPEVAVMPALLLLLACGKTRGMLACAFVRPGFLILSALIFAIASIGLLSAEFSLFEFYGRLRALYLFVIAAFAANVLSTTRHARSYGDFLLCVCVACGLCSLVFLVHHAASSEAAKAPFPVAALVIAVAILCGRGRLYAAAAVLCLMIFCAMLSFFRLNYLIALWTTVVLGTIVLTGSMARMRGRVLVGTHALLLAVLPCGLAAAAFGLAAFIGEFLVSSESRYIHSIGRVGEAYRFYLTGELPESEGQRLENALYLLRNLEYYLLPNGLLNDTGFRIASLWGGETFDVHGISPIRDSVLAYVTVLFGAIATAAFVLAGGALFVLAILSARDLRQAILSVYLAGVAVLLFLMDGTALTQFEKAFFSGTLAALAFPLENLSRLRLHSFRPVPLAVR
ncbi:MAG: hypothetical protein QHC90_15115 [Shinella sp.]|nr:hypothetical protein [Shinella sp.]